MVIVIVHNDDNANHYRTEHFWCVFVTWLWYKAE